MTMLNHSKLRTLLCHPRAQPTGTTTILTKTTSQNLNSVATLPHYPTFLGTTDDDFVLRTLISVELFLHRISWSTGLAKINDQVNGDVKYFHNCSI